jgi:uncharacterized delta-60 repeat protein/gliding motility-associated-like protein
MKAVRVFSISKHLIVFFFTGYAQLLFGQSAVYENAVRFGGTDNEAPRATCVDVSGNIYVTGSFRGTTDLDPGPGVVSFTASDSDLFIVKLNSSGDFVWGHAFGGTSLPDAGLSISVDASGNVYTTGIFGSTFGSVDFDPDPVATQFRSGQIFILKLKSDGTFDWVATVHGTNGNARSVIDASGNVFVGGHFTSTAAGIDFDHGAGTATIVSAGGTDAFAMKLNADGTFAWAKSFGGSGADRVEGIALDPSGNVLVTGSYAGTVDFDPGTGTVSGTATGSSEAYLWKLDGSGAYLDVKRIVGSGVETGRDITVDAAGNVFIAGTFSGTADFDPGTGTSNLTANGSSTIFACKLNSSLDFAWAKVMQGSSSCDVRSIKVDGVGGIYLTGNFAGNVDFNPNAGTTTLSTTGGDEIFIQKLNPNGALVWVHKFGNSGFDDLGFSLFLDASNFIYVVGQFESTVDFDPGTGTANLTSGGGWDAFMLKVSNAPVSLNISTQPQPSSECVNRTDVLTVAASGTSNIEYQWQKFNTATSTFDDLTNSSTYSGATTSSLSIETSSSTAGDYRVRVSGDFVSTILSNTVTVTTLALPAAPTATGVTTTACSATSHVLTATSPTAGTFNWYEKITHTTPYFSDASGSFPTPELAAPMTYYVAFHDGFCESSRVPVTANVTYTGPGSIDNSFMLPPNSLSNASFIDHFVIQSDGKLVLNYLEEGGNEYFVARLLTDGSLDPTYLNRDRSEFSAYVDMVVIQPDDKVIAAGRFQNISGTNYGRIVRFNTDGTIDATFNNTGAGFNGLVSTVELQPDGKILAAGGFTTYNGSASNRIARLNADGTLDATFNAGTGTNSSPNDIILQPDGKILVSGSFTTYNGTAVSTVIRLNADGSLDGSFVAPSVSSVGTLEIQADGKVLIGGGFTTVDGLATHSIARLNTNGTLDNSFSAGTAFDSDVLDIFIDSNGKILVGGWFWTENGGARNFLARLRPDGSLDNFFNGGIGSNTAIFDIKQKGSDQIYAAGYVDYWNGALHNGMALVNNQCALTPQGIDNTSCTGNITISACGGINGQYRWYTQSSGGTALAGETNSTLALSGLTSTTTYYVSLADNVCESSRVAVVANITSAGSPPTVTPSSACGGTTQTLTASGGAAGEYRWYSVASGGSAIAGETNATYTTPTLTTTTTYYVSIATGGCESSRTSVTATVNVTPSAPGVTPSSTCGPGAVTLTASGGASGEYRWYTLPSGGTAIAGETNSSYTTPSLSANTIYYVALNNGSCESARTSVTASVNGIPSQPIPTSGSRCGPGTVVLTATGGANGQYRWYAQASGGSAISGETNGSYTTVSLSATTTYYVSRHDGTCESARVSVTATINPTPLPPEAINATTCSGTSVTITATGGSAGNYRWYTQASGGSAISGEVNSSYTTPVLTGNTTFYVSIIAGGCESNRMPVQVTVSNCSNAAPVINPSPLTTQIGSSVSLNLLAIISDPDGNLDPTTLEIVIPPSSGAMASISSGMLWLDYSGIDFAGVDVLTIQVCDNLGSCTQQQISVEVVGDLVVYNAVSPNGDGLNDILFIQYIELLPGTQSNKVTIFNRWGDVLFDVANYDNVNRVFRGLNNNGNEIPSGTYFYKIEFPARREMTGYLSLRR